MKFGKGMEKRETERVWDQNLYAVDIMGSSVVEKHKGKRWKKGGFCDNK